jgi:hypothetical protein
MLRIWVLHPELCLASSSAQEPMRTVPEPPCNRRYFEFGMAVLEAKKRVGGGASRGPTPRELMAVLRAKDRGAGG